MKEQKFEGNTLKLLLNIDLFGSSSYSCKTSATAYVSAIESRYRETCYALCCACITHVITIMPASKLQFLANKNAKLAGRSQ